MDDGGQMPLDRQLDALTEAAQRELRQHWDLYQDLDGPQRVAAMREAFISIQATYGEQAAVAAADDLYLSRQGKPALADLPPPVPHQPASRGQAYHAYQAVMQSYITGGYVGPIPEKLLGAAQRLVCQPARETQAAAIAGDGTRYARVPEPGACPFCLMLASRGAVYGREAIEESDRWHDNCRCSVVEVGPGEDAPQICQDLAEVWERTGDPESFAAEIGRLREGAQEQSGREFTVPKGLRQDVSPTEPRPRLTERNMVHILDGEPVGRKGKVRGGHRAGTGRPGKTEFPPAWSDEDVRAAVEETLADPHWSCRRGDRRELRRVVVKHGQRVIVETSWYPNSDGVLVIRTAYPKCGDGVVLNGEQGIQSEPFEIEALSKER